jgi:hypothetical protein
VEWNSYTKRIDYIMYKRKKKRRLTGVDIDRTKEPYLQLSLKPLLFLKKP